MYYIKYPLSQIISACSPVFPRSRHLTNPLTRHLIKKDCETNTMGKISNVLTTIADALHKFYIITLETGV